jgi:hypothetical protein
MIQLTKRSIWGMPVTLHIVNIKTAGVTFFELTYPIISIPLHYLRTETKNDKVGRVVDICQN